MMFNLVFAALIVSVLSHPLLETSGPHSWKPWQGFDINTNYYEQVPDTGVVREYYFNITNTTAAPDGRETQVQLVNGIFPEPMIIADWGILLWFTLPVLCRIMEPQYIFMAFDSSTRTKWMAWHL